MLHNEFEKLAGLQVTEDEFNEINAMYMNAGDIDKKDFVEDWKKHKDSVILKELNDTCNFRQRVIGMNVNDIKNLKKNIEEHEDLLATAMSNHLKTVNDLKKKMAVFLIDKAEKYRDVDFARVAIELIGMKDFVGYKLQKNYTLYQKDKDYILEQMGVLQSIKENLNAGQAVQDTEFED